MMRSVRSLLRRVLDGRRPADPDVRLDDIAFAAGLHLYALELRPDGTYRTLVTTELRAMFVGDGPDELEDDVWYDDHIHPDDRARYDALFDPERVRAGGQFELSYRLVRDDGRMFEVVERARARRLPDGRVLLEGSVSDVTEERAARAHAAEVEERLQRLMVAVEEVVYTAEFDDEGNPHLVFLGPGSARLIGGPVAFEELWATFRARTNPDDWTERDEYFAKIRAGRQASRVFRLHGFDGVTRWIWSRAYPRPRVDGEPLVVDGVLSDISERHQVAEELRIARDEAQRRSRVDALTEVFNRAHFVDELTRELDRAAREGETPAVLMLDLDYFKRVNDTFLHAGGDIVLREVARRISSAVRGYDTVARWGGEEFVVLLPTVRDDDALRRIAEHVRLAISAAPIPFGDDELAVTASAGAARAGIGRFTAESLVDAADRALYSAKRRGRDRLRLFGELTESDFLMEEPDAIRIAEAMSRSASVREGVSDLHCARVADLAARVAEHLSLGATAVLRCRLGGWLHDLGKVAIPDRILSKAGPLTDDEWAVMRTHAALGGEIVGRIPGLADAAPAVRHHHERYDGGGYPDGLIGDEIPIEARIVGAVDTWSAMTEERVYRTGLIRDEALVELERSAGTQLDPEVVAALKAVLAAFPAPR
jgi:diguanylate cyclase (GGDEF)-like protein